MFLKNELNQLFNNFRDVIMIFSIYGTIHLSVTTSAYSAPVGWIVRSYIVLLLYDLPIMRQTCP